MEDVEVDEHRRARGHRQLALLQCPAAAEHRQPLVDAPVHRVRPEDRRLAVPGDALPLLERGLQRSRRLGRRLQAGVEPVLRLGEAQAADPRSTVKYGEPRTTAVGPISRVVAAG